jgi:formylmethanofuran dehydrogenase subunit E
MRQLTLLMCLFLAVFAVEVRAETETPEEWVRLGRRVHGGFGTYVVVGIRIGLDAMERLEASPRDLDVTYLEGLLSPCPCVVDGIMIATVSTPGQNSLRVLPTRRDPNTFGVAIIKNKKTGQALRYTLPNSVRSQLDSWNQSLTERQRYDAVMNAPADSLYIVEPSL